MQDATDTAAEKDGLYRVLARKYRPGTFSELIGQEPMVRTLKNAIEKDRLAHAFILTGVRGVGKTTTARLIARALNCIGEDGQGGPTVSPCGVCEHCRSIADSRHVDVIEMDAASRTGVDDVREIIDGVRYAPSSARYKIYIIDEVHMLSKNAFNALLKTLEEPPEHVIFIFATTEIRKVPVTVLSRCQRFDLRRVDMETLQSHFSDIAAKEGADLEPEAIALIARAADGSVRDGLSLLDQAIAHGAGKVTAEQVRDMLGLADRTQVMRLFEDVMRGDIAAALENLGTQYTAGADPESILQDMLELVHWVSEVKAVPDRAERPGVAEAEKDYGKRLADGLAMPALTRAWQMLLKGLEEVRFAPQPLAATEMVLIRLAYAADLPNPADLVKQLRDQPQVTGPGAGAGPGAGGGAGAADSAKPSPEPSAQPAPTVTAAQPTETGSSPAAGPGPTDSRAEEPGPSGPVAQRQPHETPTADEGPQPVSFEAVVALCGEKGELRMQHQLTDNVHLVDFQPGKIELRLTEQAIPNLAGTLGQKLSEWTGRRWIVTVSQKEGAATLLQQQQVARARLEEEVRQTPLVRAALEIFPGAQIGEIVDLDEADANEEGGISEDLPLPAPDETEDEE